MSDQVIRGQYGELSYNELVRDLGMELGTMHMNWRMAEVELARRAAEIAQLIAHIEASAKAVQDKDQQIADMGATNASLRAQITAMQAEHREKG